MELRHYLLIALRWLWLFLLSAVVAGTTAFVWSRSQEPLYRARSILLVNSADESQNDLLVLRSSEQLAFSYAERLTNREVLSAAIERLGLDLDPAGLRGRVSVAIVERTHLIELAVVHHDAQTAADLANEIPAVFAERNLAQQLERFAGTKASLEKELAELQAEVSAAEAAIAARGEISAETRANENLLSLRETHARLLQSYENVRVAEAISLDTLIIDEAAVAPGSPFSPRTATNTVLAAIIGLMLAAGLVFLVEYFDDTIRSPQGIEAATGVTVLGTIRRVKVSNPSDVLVVALEPRSPAAEAYRQVRTNLQYMAVDRDLKSILITSAGAGEGKSTTAANLATALAQSGKRVILVDADMRRPTLDHLLGVKSEKGLSDLIISGRLDPAYLRHSLIPNLRLLPAGRLPPNPAEFLASERMKAVHSWLQGRSDFVIYDSPPLLAVTDAAILSRLVDTMLFVASASQTRYQTLAAAVGQVQALDAHIAGVVVNKVRSNGLQYYSRYYYQVDYRRTPAPQPPSLRRRLEAVGSFLTSFLS